MANKRIPELDPVVTAAQSDKFIVRQSGDVEDKHVDMDVMQLALLLTESQITDLQSYLLVEVNDLSAAVVWDDIPDANVPESAVTQHEAALTITESQISDLQAYLLTEANDLSAAVVWADIPDANVPESAVTQHEAALSITESQISDLQAYLLAELNDLTAAVVWADVPDTNITESSVTQHEAALTITESQISDLQAYLLAELNDLTAAVVWDDIPDANVPESAVTQHEAALSITESQISDLSHTIGVSGLGIWKYRTETSAPPATGQIRFNNANISAATEFYLHETNEGGVDVSTFLELLLQDGSVLYIQDQTDAANFVLIEISSSVDNGSYRTFGIQSVTEEGTEPGQNDDVVLITTGLASAAGVVEVNDLTAAVTWADIPDTNVPESAVTQHEAALSITESQISDLQAYLLTEANDLSAAVVWDDIPDANVPESAVTQHEAALSITESQISDLQAYLLAELNDLTAAVVWANVPDGNITESSVTQHEGALSIAESQITDGSILARLAANESISGEWTHSDTLFLASPGVFAPALRVISTVPVQSIVETDAALDEKAWDTVAVGGQLRFRTTEDDFTGGVTWMAVNRTAAVVDSIAFSGDVTAPNLNVATWDTALLPADIGVSVQAFDANTAFTDVAESISNNWKWLDNVGLNFGTGNDWSFLFNGGDLQLIAAGAADPTSFQIFDAGGLKWELDHGNDRMWLRDGYVFRISSSDDTDFAEFSHDLTDFLTAFTTTVDWNITGLSGRIKQGAETLAFLSEVGTGDVTETGSSVDGQVAVWTGPGDIEGTTAFVVGANSIDTTLRYRAAFGSSGAPVFSFTGETNSGLFRNSAGVLMMSVLGTPSWVFRNTSFDANIAGGPRMLLEASTDTNPVFAPFLGNNTTGIGGVSGTVALIGSGVTLAKTVAAASGGLQANNTLTGAGLERVLTVGDLPAASVENDAAQIRRTTDYTLTTAFVDVTFDTTDIETDTAVIEHNVATDDIDLKVAGTYQVFIDMQIIADATTGEPDILANARIRVNDTGTGVAGSTASTYSVRDGSIGAGDGQVDLHFSHSFIVTVVEAPDKITLQLSKTEINESAAFLARDITMKVVRLT